MLCLAAKASIARTLGVGATPVPITLKFPMTKDREESRKFSVLIVKGYIFAPDAKTGRNLERGG